MVECEICLEDYKEGDLELHRKMCVLRLMFRCSLCHGDYVSKEGLWNHLDLHEIADESKESHYQEIKAKHKLHQCVLCNDQRAYSESSYWKHVHDVHDGFFLRCSDCGENFRSEKLKNDHQCKTRDQIEASNLNALETKLESMEVEHISYSEHLKPSLQNQSSNENAELSNRLSDFSNLESFSEPIVNDKSDQKVVVENSSNETSCTKCSHCGIEETSADTLARHILIHHEPVACDLCGITFPSLSLALHHKETQHKQSKMKCPHCLMQFCVTIRLNTHVSICEKRTVPCECCGKMYTDETAVKRHWSKLKYVKSKKKGLKNTKTPPHVKSGLSQTKCDYCNEEFSSPGHLIHHLQIRHELTKCNICGITILGISASKNHKIKCHTEPKYECHICERKFHHKIKYLEHSVGCQQKTYSCKICGTTFKRSHAIYLHTKRFHPGESSLENLQIIQDQKRFQNNDLQMEITAEENTISAKDALHQCVLCNDQRGYSESSYWKHVHDVHDGFFLQCSDCGENFRSEKLKNDHAVSHCEARDKTVAVDLNSLKEEPVRFDDEDMTSDAEPMELSREEQDSNANAMDSAKSKDVPSQFACDICGMTFSLKGLLLRHKTMKHTKLKRHSNVCDPVQSDFSGDNISDELMLENSSDPKVTEDNSSSHHALSKVRKQTEDGQVPIEVENITSEAEHWKIKQEEQSSNTNRMSLKNSGQLILNDRSDPSVAGNNSSSTKCSHCGIEESSAVNLVRHILTHHEPVACDFCGITLSSLVEAQRHKKATHKESKHKCPHCLIQFFGKQRVVKHASRCAKQKVPCQYCGKMLKDAMAVKLHRNNDCHVYKRSNEQEQMYTETSLCDESDSCPIMEKNSAPLVKSGLSQTKCDYCNEEFPSPGHLIRHLQIIHELTKCDICGITVLGLSRVKNHKMKCHREPKYECPTCKKKFHRKAKYNAHSFVCENKNSCKLCGMKFKQPHSLKRHTEHIHLAESSLAQHQNKKLKMARDDPRQSTDSRSNKHSLANKSDNDLMDSGKEPGMGSENTSVENLSNQQYSCNTCDVTLSTYGQIVYHKLTKHTEGKFECSYCSRKFHFKDKLEKHAAYCVGLIHSCELCGEKFNRPKRVENHKKRVHNIPMSRPYASVNRVKKPLKNAYAGQGMTRCIICKVTFASTDELIIHKLTCPKLANEHNDSQIGAKEVPLLPATKETQTDSTIVFLQGENNDLELDIKVEETILQEQEYQVPNEDPRSSSATTLHPHDSKPKDVEAEVAEDLGYEIKVKEEYIEDEDEILTEHQSTAETSECHGVASDQNESLVAHNADDWPCTICGLNFASLPKMRYHKRVSHAKPRYKCSICQKPFHFANLLRRHEKSCSELRCNKCGVKFMTHRLLNIHYNDKHPDDGKPKDVEAEDAEDLENEIKVKEEYIEDVDEILTAHQSTAETSECHGVASDQNESLVTQSTGDWPCSICELNFASLPKMRYHKRVSHEKPRYKCSICQKPFHFANLLRRHEKSCSEMRCNKCGVKFMTHRLLNIHYDDKHPDEGKPKNVEAEDAEDL
ncbi:zinc finger protein 62-like isoform X2 [Ochlerotatus camptorhynchus]|uniref:zinc finger protein 62-like isoform X2 n=1 Tax=Ochlerotatus camptorhynchus TaxID=644619 RepID=UPI0031CEBECF